MITAKTSTFSKGPGVPYSRELEQEEDHFGNGLKKPRWNEGSLGSV